MTQSEFIASLGLDPAATRAAYPNGLLSGVLQPGQGEWSYWNTLGLSRDQSQYIQNNNFDAQNFRLTGDDANKWNTDPALQQILQGVGGAVQYDPVYGQYIPIEAQNQWNKQFNNDGIWDTLGNFANNLPIALGGAVLSGGLLGVGPLANASTIPGGPLLDVGSWFNNLGLPSGSGSGGGGGLGGNNVDLLDWINDNWDSSVMGDPSAYGLNSDPSFGWGTDELSNWGVDELGDGWGNEIGGDAGGDSTVSSGGFLDSLKNLFGGSGTGGVNLGGLLGGTSGIGDLLSKGLAVAPSLAAIAYARNQDPFDTSKLESIYGQYSPSGQTYQYDQATGAGRGQLASNLARRGISGSSFGDQSLTNYDTTRTLGRNALLNQGATTQANIANSIIAAQAKDRELKNTLYGSALYALAGGLAPKTRY